MRKKHVGGGRDCVKNKCTTNERRAYGQFIRMGGRGMDFRTIILCITLFFSLHNF